MTHGHTCPSQARGCGIEWECEAIPCAALPLNGQKNYYCDLCWGYFRAARTPVHELPAIGAALQQGKFEPGTCMHGRTPDVLCGKPAVYHVLVGPVESPKGMLTCRSHQATAFAAAKTEGLLHGHLAGEHCGREGAIWREGMDACGPSPDPL